MATIRFHMPDGSERDCGACMRDLNMLGHAQLIELEIGSECGGHGICGGDKVRIDDPAARALMSDITAEEEVHLSSAEIAQGWRLACQCYPNRDGMQVLALVR